jgi:Cu+-exporting ATPase
MKNDSPDSNYSQQSTEYTCPMHLKVIQDHSGNCPICGMYLESKTIQTNSHDNHELKDIQLRFVIGVLLVIPLLLIAMGSMLSIMNHYIPPQISRWLQLIREKTNV